MNNSEWVRAMTDDELAFFIAGSRCECCIYHNRECTEHEDMNCIDGVCEWFKCEHKESECNDEE